MILSWLENVEFMLAFCDRFCLALSLVMDVYVDAKHSHDIVLICYGHDLSHGFGVSMANVTVMVVGFMAMVDDFVL